MTTGIPILPPLVHTVTAGLPNSGELLAATESGAVNQGAINASLMEALRDSPLADSLRDSAVPLEVAARAFAEGVHGPATGWRLGGVDDPTTFKLAVDTISNPDIAVNSALHLFGFADVSPEVQGGLSLFLGAALLSASFFMITKEYRKNMLAPGNALFSTAARWTAFWYSFYAFMNVVEFSLPQILRNGFTMGALTFNTPFFVAKNAVWGLFSPIWSTIAFLPFVLSGPFFKRISMRRQTEHDAFIVSEGRFHRANPDNVKTLLEKGRGSLTFTTTAEHLADKKMRNNFKELPDQAEGQYTQELHYKDLKRMAKKLKGLHDAGLRVSITSSSATTVKNREVSGREGVKTVLIKQSRVKATPQLDGLVQKGIAFRSRKYPTLLILQKDLELLPASMETSPDNGQFAGPIRVERGVIKETKGLDINHDRSWEKNGGFQVVVSGPAKEILSQVSRAFYNKPGWFGLPPLARKFWRRHVEPTPGTVSLKLPQNHEPTHEELAALSGIAGDKQYAGRLVSAPTVAVSRAVLEKIVGDSGSPENLKKEVLLEMPLDFYEAHLKAIPVAEAIDKKYLTGNKSFVRVKVAADSIMKALHGEGGLGSLDADAFIDAVKDRTLRIGLENPLKPPQILFKLTPVEDVAVQVDPGSTKSLHDLEFKTDDPEYRPQFLKILARTARQGTAGGRGRAIGSFTFVGATFFSLPTNILMNAFFGYVDPEMWVKDATKSYFTRGLNMTFAPPILSRLKGGVLDYTAFHLYMPGMIFMGLLYSPIMSLTTGEPDAMLAKNAMVDLSMEKRIKERQQSQEKLLERERVVSNKKRNGLIENRLAHFLSTGYVREGDMKRIDALYEKHQKTPSAKARILAGLMNDTAFTHMMRTEHPQRFAHYKNEVALNAQAITDVLGEAGIVMAQLDPAWSE